MDDRVTGSRMGYQNGVLDHVVGNLRAQSTVGLDETFEDYFKMIHSERALYGGPLVPHEGSDIGKGT
eukprot:12893430-Prorocentrum_lima.AAC.1